MPKYDPNQDESSTVECSQCFIPITIGYNTKLVKPLCDECEVDEAGGEQDFLFEQYLHRNNPE